MALLVIVATIAASILTANGLLDEAVTKGYISDANNWIRTLASLLVLSFVYLFWSILKYPPIIHNEQGNKIRSLNNRLKIKTIKTTKIIFKPKDALLEDSKGYWYAYLEILNSENYDLRNCSANLEALNIRDSNNEKWVNWIEWTTRDSTELTWTMFKHEEEKIIRRGKTAIIKIAKMKIDSYPLFIFAHEKEESMSATQNHITISLIGELYKNEKFIPIKELVFCGYIKQYKGSYTQEGMTITTIRNGERYTETEPSEEIPEFRLWIEPGELDDEKDKKTD